MITYQTDWDAITPIADTNDLTALAYAALFGTIITILVIVMLIGNMNKQKEKERELEFEMQMYKNRISVAIHKKAIEQDVYAKSMATVKVTPKQPSPEEMIAQRSDEIRQSAKDRIFDLEHATQDSNIINLDNIEIAVPGATHPRMQE